jgi:two-component system sensor histidine kinase PilS (NtrC family)
MAAVIAHEVKNPLAGIRGAVQVIGSRLASDNNDATIVREIVSRIDGLNGLIQDLLLFARPPRPKPVPIEVSPLLAMTASLLRQDPALTGVHVEVVGSAPPVVADPDLLKLVFSNLFINGAHAMHGRGRISVSIESPAPWCRVAIRDEGPGIPADIRDKIFVPFFTTKSRGTGLGLPTAKRLIEAHQGTISVDCPSDGGTIVTVQLPLASSPASTPGAGPLLDSV